MSLYDIAKEFAPSESAEEYLAYCKKTKYDNTTGDYEITLPKQRR